MPPRSVSSASAKKGGGGGGRVKKTNANGGGKRRKVEEEGEEEEQDEEDATAVDDDEDDEDDGYDSDLMGDEADRAYLDELPEAQREQILFERSEARQQRQERARAKAQAAAVVATAPANKNERGAKTKRGPTKQQQQPKKKTKAMKSRDKKMGELSDEEEEEEEADEEEEEEEGEEEKVTPRRPSRAAAVAASQRNKREMDQDNAKRGKKRKRVASNDDDEEEEDEEAEEEEAEEEVDEEDDAKDAVYEDEDDDMREKSSTRSVSSKSSATSSSKRANDSSHDDSSSDMPGSATSTTSSLSFASTTSSSSWQSGDHDTPSSSSSSSSSSKPNIFIPGLSTPLRYESLKNLQLRRAALERLFDEPYFPEMAKGLFVRVVVGASSTGQSVYKVGEIIEVQEARMKYKFGNRDAKVALLLRHGNVDRTFLMTAVSNQRLTEEEMNKWLAFMKQHNAPVLSNEEARTRLLRSTRIRETFQYTDADIEAMLQRNEGKLTKGTNLVQEKVKLVHQLEAAKARGDESKIDELQRRIDEIDELEKAKQRRIMGGTAGMVQQINTMNRKSEMSERLKRSQEQKRQVSERASAASAAVKANALLASVLAAIPRTFAEWRDAFESVALTDAVDATTHTPRVPAEWDNVVFPNPPGSLLSVTATRARIEYAQHMRALAARLPSASQVALLDLYRARAPVDAHTLGTLDLSLMQQVHVPKRPTDYVRPCEWAVHPRIALLEAARRERERDGGEHVDEAELEAALPPTPILQLGQYWARRDEMEPDQDANQ